MNLRGRIPIRAKVDYVCRGPDNRIKWTHHTPANTITELHDVLVADRISGGTDALMTHGHCGTSTGGTSASTNLVARIDEARTAVDSTTQGSGASDNDVVIVVTFPAGVCTATITEFGLFSSSNQDTADMKTYDDTLSKVKEALDSLVVTWTGTYGAS